MFNCYKYKKYCKSRLSSNKCTHVIFTFSLTHTCVIYINQFFKFNIILLKFTHFIILSFSKLITVFLDHCEEILQVHLETFFTFNMVHKTIIKYFKFTITLNELNINFKFIISDCKSLNIRTDDYYLTKFLICEDWDAKRTFQRLERWFQLKVDYPDWFYNKPISALEKTIKMNCKVLLEKPDIHGRLIYLTTFKNVSSSKTSATEMAQLDNFWFELAHLNPASHKNGIVCLVDFTG